MATDHQFTISEFVNIIRTLELAGYVFQYQRVNLSDDFDYVQLPSKVTIDYLKLQASVQSEELKTFYSPVNTLNNFISTLTRYARFHHWYYPSIEKSHAEYLLGFLLQQDLTIVHDGTVYELNEIINQLIPDIEKQETAHYWFEERRVPPEPYDFLSESWRKKQEYPQLKALEIIWQQHATDIEYQKQQAVLIAEQKAQREQEEQEAYAQWRKTHFFDDTILDYQGFSFVLEAIVKSGRISLFKNQELLFQNKLVLSLPLSILLLKFSQSARKIQPSSLWYYQQVASNFELVLCELMACAKYDIGQYGDGARQLMGFLLFHNFCVQHGNKRLRMQEIFWEQATRYERALLLEGPNAHPCTFIYLEWQQQQNYPGKQALEIILQREQSMVSQSKTFLNAFPAYQYQSQLQTNQTNQMKDDECHIEQCLSYSL
tara:strand:+ start:32119 stop:33411 length:1293 start_codon:yes stop_codon:yes gene_type:complete